MSEKVLYELVDGLKRENNILRMAFAMYIKDRKRAILSELNLTDEDIQLICELEYQKYRTKAQEELRK